MPIKWASLRASGRKGLGAIFCREKDQVRYRSLAFGTWLDDFVEALFNEGYSSHTVQSALIRLRDVGEFLATLALGPAAITDSSVISAYIDLWRKKTGQIDLAGGEKNIRHAIALLADHGRQAGHLPPETPSPNPLPGWLHGYLDFLAEHRGLTPSTIVGYRSTLLRLAEFLGESGQGDQVELDWDTLERFVAELGRKFKRRSLYGAMASVRGLLRFRFMVGLESQDRSGWLDFPMVYREEDLPHFLSEPQLQEAMRAVDRSQLVGKRDWAVLILLSTYGFRAGEVSRLRLTDLDFARGLLLVRRLKGGKEQRFPMTDPVRRALLDYLEVRPKTDIQEVFLTLKAPIRPFCKGGSLSGTCVRKYLEKVPGLTARGAHALRHTVARRLRRSGASLGELHTLLGHVECADSTARYLRISLEELREVAGGYADLL